MSSERRREIERAMEAWRKFGAGRYATPADRNTALSVVRSFELELKTGKPHCPCHLKPV